MEHPTQPNTRNPPVDRGSPIGSLGTKSGHNAATATTASTSSSAEPAQGRGHSAATNDGEPTTSLVHRGPSPPRTASCCRSPWFRGSLRSHLNQRRRSLCSHLTSGGSGSHFSQRARGFDCTSRAPPHDSLAGPGRHPTTNRWCAPRTTSSSMRSRRAPTASCSRTPDPRTCSRRSGVSRPARAASILRSRRSCSSTYAAAGRRRGRTC